MSITSTTLTRTAAIALAVAGAIFIAIQPLHPHEDIAGITSSMWVVVHLLSWTMAVLGLTGITAVYLSQVRRFGIVGLLGYLVFSLFFLIQACVNFAEAFILPLSAAGSPALTVDIASLFVSGYVLQTDVGLLAIVGSVGGLLYLGGAVLFGIAVIRANVLPPVDRRRPRRRCAGFTVGRDPSARARALRRDAHGRRSHRSRRDPVRPPAQRSRGLDERTPHIFHRDVSYP